MQDTIDLAGWFQVHLFAELQVPGTGCGGAQQFLHRRIVWLLGKVCWCHYELRALQGGNHLPAEMRSSLVSTVGAAVGQMQEVSTVCVLCVICAGCATHCSNWLHHNCGGLRSDGFVLLQTESCAGGRAAFSS